MKHTDAQMELSGRMNSLQRDVNDCVGKTISKVEGYYGSEVYILYTDDCYSKIKAGRLFGSYDSVSLETNEKFDFFEDHVYLVKLGLIDQEEVHYLSRLLKQEQQAATDAEGRERYEELKKLYGDDQ